MLNRLSSSEPGSHRGDRGKLRVLSSFTKLRQ
jgi:hypothetical protein